jgi:hypothetical protein
VGLESGVLIVDEYHFDVCACALFDGAACHVGLSSAFQLPQGVVKAMFNVRVSERIGYNESFQAIGIPSDENSMESDAERFVPLLRLLLLFLLQI